MSLEVCADGNLLPKSISSIKHRNSLIKVPKDSGQKMYVKRNMLKYLTRMQDILYDLFLNLQNVANLKYLEQQKYIYITIKIINDPGVAC